MLPVVTKWRAGTLSAGDFWQQHSEHRVAGLKAFIWTIGSVTDFDVIAQMYVGFIFVVITLVLVGDLLRISAKDHQFPSTAFTLPASSLLLFSLVQQENWFWATASLQLSLLNLCTVMLVWAFTRWPDYWRSLTLAAGCAVLGMFTEVSGQVLWIIGALAISLGPQTRRAANSTIDCLDPGGLVGICRICLASPLGRIVGLSSPQASGSRGALCRRLPWTPVRFVDESGLVCHRWLGRLRNLGCGLVVYLQMRPAPLSQPAALPLAGDLRAAGLHPHSNWPRRRRPSVGADEPLCLRADVVLDGARRRPAGRRSGRLAPTESASPDSSTRSHRHCCGYVRDWLCPIQPSRVSRGLRAESQSANGPRDVVLSACASARSASISLSSGRGTPSEAYERATHVCFGAVLDSLEPRSRAARQAVHDGACERKLRRIPRWR